MNKKLHILIPAAAALLAAVFIVICISNARRGAAIYDQFLGRTFTGETEEDDGFIRDYNSGNLNPYTTYYETTEGRTLTFQQDGTVTFLSTMDMVVLAHPKVISKPDDYHSAHDGTYSSFSVTAGLLTGVQLTVGSTTCSVRLNQDGVPIAILDYEGVDLYAVD